MIAISSATKFFLKNQPKGYIPKHTRHVLDFSSLTNVLGFSPKVKRAIKKIDFSLMNQYGDRDCLSLKKKIAQWLSVPADHISLGNGSDELIDTVARIFIDPCDIVVTQTPTFFRVIEASLKMQAKVITVAANASEIIFQIKKHQPKIVWLCSPCNPTGETISQSSIAKIAAAGDVVVVVDEAYQEIFDPENKLSAVHLLPKHKNLLVLKSFSKAFGLAGIRVGLVVGDPNIIDILEKTRLNFNISVFSQKIAEAALSDLAFLKKCSSFFKKERAWLFSEIKKQPNLVLGADSKINVFILKHKIKDIFQELLKRRIMAADFRQANGLEGKGFVRITIKNRKENKILLKALKIIDK